MQNYYFFICWGIYVSNFYEGYMSSLSTIYHYVSLALHKETVNRFRFQLQLSRKEYPLWHLKEFHHHLNYDLTYTIYWNLQSKIDFEEKSLQLLFQMVSEIIGPPGIKTSWRRRSDVSLYVPVTSQVRLKWNTQRRLDGTSPRRLSGASLRKHHQSVNWEILKFVIF